MQDKASILSPSKHVEKDILPHYDFYEWDTVVLKVLIAEPVARHGLRDPLQQTLPNARLLFVDERSGTDGRFDRTDSAGEGVLPFDIAFVDASFCYGRGVDFARDLQRQSKQANVVLVGDTPEQLADGFPLQCSGYVLAPLTRNAICQQLSNTRYPLQLRGDLPAKTLPPSQIYARCFGTFEVFCEGVPLRTKRQKSKELLACLVCQRGALFSVGDVEAVLWELSPYTSSNQSYLRHLVADLKKSLETVGAQDMLVKRRGFLGINPNAFECDYYDFLDGKPDAPPFAGQFMSQYSWAEPLGAALGAMR